MLAPEGSGKVSADNTETASLRWVSPEEEARLIQRTTNAKGRARDLAVLAAALEQWKTCIQDCARE